MRKVLMIMFMTMDGRAQFPVYPDGGDPSAEDDPMWRPRMHSIDTLLLGRNAYHAWAAHWPRQKENPNAGAWAKEFSRFADQCEKVVFSKSLENPDWPKTRVVRGSPTEEIAKLRKEEGKNLALGGGPRLAQSFLAADLVDEILTEVFPSLVGTGKPMFKTVDDPNFKEDRIPVGAPGRLDFRLREAWPMTDSTLFLRYERQPR